MTGQLLLPYQLSRFQGSPRDRGALFHFYHYSMVLPKFAITDPDHVSTGVWSVSSNGASVQEISVLMSSMRDIFSQFTTTMNNVMQRLSDLESRILSDYLAMSSVQSASLQRPNVHNVTPASQTSAKETLPSDGTASTSWADQAKDLVAAGQNFVFNKHKPPVRIRGRASSGNIKGVPRQLTCFAARIHQDVTKKDLTNYLQDQGISDVQCRKRPYISNISLQSVM